MARSLSAVVRDALHEDIGPGDVTSEATVTGTARGEFVAKQDLVFCGVEVAREVFRQTVAKFIPVRRDGDRVKKGAVLARVSGPARAILAGERTAVNFLQHLSGVATLTRKFVDLAKPAKVLDTRKTTPGLRALEKHAVRCGGGTNHRMGLYDSVLIKDNHIAGVHNLDRLRDIVEGIHGHVEIEAASLDQAMLFATWPVGAIMLDNFDVSALRRAVREVRKINPRVILEASGGVSLRTVRAIARTGVDWISVGAITHSAPAVDISLEL